MRTCGPIVLAGSRGLTVPAAGWLIVVAGSRGLTVPAARRLIVLAGCRGLTAWAGAMRTCGLIEVAGRGGLTMLACWLIVT
ncbi:MAG: hypothetical protein ACRDOK_29975, partial [Streptosporangiaceae bacterium]